MYSSEANKKSFRNSYAVCCTLKNVNNADQGLSLWGKFLFSLILTTHLFVERKLSSVYALKKWHD
jgi:hypothetical protein